MERKGGSLVMIALGLVFFSVGAGFGWFSVRTLLRAEEMRRWSEVPAQLESCDLKATRGSKGGYTYQVSATYRYAFKGVGYTGDRVSLHTGSDNIGTFQQRLYDTLRRKKEAKEAVACWVNPEKPGESILVRRPRPELLVLTQLFVVSFGCAGLGVVLAGLGVLLRPSWRVDGGGGAGQGRLVMRGASSHRVAGALALAWNGYTGWFLWKFFHVIRPEPMPWYLWLFGALGLAPLAIAGYLIGRHRKFGVSVFELSPMPGVLGGPVKGTVRIPARVETEEGIEVVLQCIHQYTTGSGKSRSTHCDVLWEDAQHFDAAQAAYGDETILPVRFWVPYDNPATTAPGGRNGYYWQLKVTAVAPGIDYKAVFDVPVRRTPQSAQADASGRAAEPVWRTESAGDVVQRASLRLEPRPDGGFELVFPAARMGAGGLALWFLFLAAWTAACVAFWTVARIPPGPRLVVTVLNALFALLFFHELLVVRGIAVDRAARECVVWWRVAGFPRLARRVPFEQVLDLRSERAGQYGSRMVYRVVLATASGVPLTVGSGIGMWNDAEHIARLLSSATKPAFQLESVRL